MSESSPPTMSIQVSKTCDDVSMRAHQKALLLAAEVAAEQLLFEMEYLHTKNQVHWANDPMEQEEDSSTWMLYAHRSIYDESVCPCVSMSPVFNETMNEYFCCKECNARRERLQRLTTH